MRDSYRRRLITVSVLLIVSSVLIVMSNWTSTRAAVVLLAQTKSVDVSACEACHGTNGISTSAGVPNLAGQKAGYLAAQLKAFKNNERKNDLMSAIAGQLSDADIQALAQYWSSRPATLEGHEATGAPIHSRMAFPSNFPSGFTLYQTVTDEGNITKRYANAVAIEAVRTGKQLPDGSIIIGVNQDAHKDASGKVVAGAVKSYAAMESQAGWGNGIPALLKNDNWDYAVFTGDRVRNDSLNQAQCLACHKTKAADSYVFTMKDLRETVMKPAR